MSAFEERLALKQENRDNIIYNEHLVRYQLASSLVKGKKVLDLACGTGYGSHLLAQAGAQQVIGIDVDNATIALNKQNWQADNLEYLVGQAESLDYPDNHFDLIVSFETIEHLKDYDSYLGELKRVVKKDGLVLISTPNREIFKEKNPFHLKEFDRREFSSLIAEKFNYSQILEQGNALASVIKVNREAKLDLSELKPLYFIALCSHSEIPTDLLQNSFVSVNSLALEKKENNPVLKFSDAIYRLLQRIGLKK